MLKQSVVGAPFVRILQTMPIWQTAHKTFREKRGKFSVIRAKAFQKRLVVRLVEIGHWRSLRSNFQIEVLFEALNVIMRR